MFEHLLFLKDHYKHGQTTSYGVLNIKYEPKKRKRGRKRRIECSDELSKDDRNDDDIDPEELIENQQLIELVKEHPVLYDKYKIRDSKNLTLKNDAWFSISESMGISEEICHKRWKKLRDRFAREYRHQQLYPDRPTTWVYFQDLTFLEEHYRKGIPLPVDAIRQRKKAKSATLSVEESWGDDCPFLYVKDEDQIKENSDDIDQEFSEMSSACLDDLIIEPKCSEPNDQLVTEVTMHNSLTMPTTEFQSNKLSIDRDEPEKKLSTLISGIENVLQQSQDCLKSLQKQNEQQKRHLLSKEYSTFDSNISMLQKIHVLLDGLSERHRNLAERRIIQFLCECQINSLNDVDVEDVDCSLDF
ncbi:unnamed protein product [Ceratitis capitata]|nr:unnamed protein product [Ceratitis capitata]